MKIASLPISIRAINVLHMLGAQDCEQLQEITAANLIKCRGCGPSTAREIAVACQVLEIRTGFDREILECVPNPAAVAKIAAGLRNHADWLEQNCSKANAEKALLEEEIRARIAAV